MNARVRRARPVRLRLGERARGPVGIRKPSPFGVDALFKLFPRGQQKAAEILLCSLMTVEKAVTVLKTAGSTDALRGEISRYRDYEEVVGLSKWLEIDGRR